MVECSVPSQWIPRQNAIVQWAGGRKAACLMAFRKQIRTARAGKGDTPFLVMEICDRPLLPKLHLQTASPP